MQSSAIRALAFPVLWWFRPYDFDYKWIQLFLKWFGSIVGFKQQMGLMMVWVIMDLLHPNADPNMLHLMAFLTIYSAITQPMIAIQNDESGKKLDTSQLLLIQTVQSQETQIRAMKEMIQELQVLVKKEDNIGHDTPVSSHL